MNINRASALLKPEQIKTVEETRGAKYVCEIAIKTKEGWANQPTPIFWQPVKHPISRSHYFALFRQEGHIMITSGQSAVDEPFQGVRALDEQVYFSRWRHDFRNIPGGFIDGGRDYMRCGDQICQAQVINLKIIGPDVVSFLDAEVIEDVKLLEHKA